MNSCMIIHITYRTMSFLDLSSAIRNSFTPEPVTVVLDSVVDGKEWMEDITPSLHDHLKAHQFKFQRDETGECKMFYKEWSTDTFWLPQTGLSLLPAGGSTKSVYLCVFIMYASQTTPFSLDN